MWRAHGIGRPGVTARQRTGKPASAALVALLIGSLCLLLAACGSDGPAERDDLEAVALAYVRLVLGVGEHDGDFVDAYYGSASLRDEVRKEARSLEALAADAESIATRLAVLPPAATEGDALLGLRRSYLAAQLDATATRIRMLGGERLSFDDESAALFGAVAPENSQAYFAARAEALASRLAAEGFESGTLGERYAAFQAAFTIPPERVDAVFRTAIDACRERTRARIALPAEEAFTVEYVTDQPWSAYNWYQGGYRSLIQVNLDLPIAIDRAIDLACHEGYPGHHVYNLLLEQQLVRERGWPEYQVYPLFSPQSLIAEGTANFGIEMAFPGAQRLAFERDVLFPRAGLDPARAEAYDAVRSLAHELRYAGNEAARALLDGEKSADEATDWLVRYAAMSPERAAQRVRFIERYRSYVINYNLGADLVASYIDRQAGTDPTARWEVFEALLSSPRLPAGLR